MSHTERQDVTYYSGHVIEVNGKRYAQERTCNPNVWCDGTEECHGVYERWLAECGSCGAILNESACEERVRIGLPSYCPNCGAKVTEEDTCR